MNYEKKTIHDVDFNNKVTLVRVDFNVPVCDGIIEDDTRIIAALDTIKYLLNKETKIVLLSHFGRVKSLDDLKKRSLLPVYNHLKTLLPDVEINFEENNINPDLKNIIGNMPNKSILLLENTRFNDIDEFGNIVKNESGNNEKLSKFWASLGDVFVNEAFGTSHRSHASNVGIANNIKESCIGFLIQKELQMLTKALTKSEHPIVAIFGGAKVSDKIKSIENIATIADYILIGGGMSYTFQKCRGYDIGKSLFDEESFEISKNLLEKYGDKIVLPVDVHASIEFADTKPTKFKIENFGGDYEGLDIGGKTIKIFKRFLKNAKTILWNGPLGVCEFSNYQNGTKQICKIIAKSAIKNNCFTLVGGGDSAAAVTTLGFGHFFTHISTGGGATITFLEGSELVGISSIQNIGDPIKDVEVVVKQKEITPKSDEIKKESKTTKSSSKKADKGNVKNTKKLDKKDVSRAIKKPVPKKVDKNKTANIKKSEKKDVSKTIKKPVPKSTSGKKSIKSVKKPTSKSKK